jgi:sugar lactone lactonase YvrE
MSRAPATLPALLAVALLACEDARLPMSPDTTDSTQEDAAVSGPLEGGGSSMWVTFDPSLGELPEGVAVDHDGSLLVSIAPLGQVRKIGLDGSQSVLATLGAPTFGLAVDRFGNTYAAVASGNPATHGVWRIDGEGNSERLAGSQNIVFPNAIALSPTHHTLYITDSVLGAVWSVRPEGAAQLWIQHPLLQGTGVIRPDGLPLGANGIVFHGHALFVAVTEGARIVRIPVEGDGSAGAPVVFAAAPQLFTVDGLGADERGNLYAVIIGFHQVIRISRDASEITTIATAEDGLDFPASIAFGRRGRHGLVAFVTNFAVRPSADPDRPGPGIVRIPVGNQALGRGRLAP